MFKTINWTERKFSFDFSPDIFPCIVERLRGTPIRLEEKLLPLSEDIIKKSYKNGWSILEHAGHLIDLEELGEIRLKEFLDNKEILSSADISNKKTNEKGYNFKSKDEVLLKFREVRINFVKAIQDLKRDEVSIISFHPRLKMNMRLVDWLYFIAEHDDHHLAKIYEIYREFI